MKFTEYLVDNGAELNKICDQETGNHPIHIAF